MNNLNKYLLVIFLLAISMQADASADDYGHISGTLTLDDSWEREIYISLIETIEKEYAVSNEIIITSASIDSLGNFILDLESLPTTWSILRLHVVKRGVSPNSLIIGSLDENFIFIIAKRDSQIELYNTKEQPLFVNSVIKGADYMQNFDYIRILSDYPNSIDYDQSIIEEIFIKEAVAEKLKKLADTCSNPIVALYAIYQTDFQTDYLQDPTFYNDFLSKWEGEDNAYFRSFRQKFAISDRDATDDVSASYTIPLLVIAGILLTSFYIYSMRTEQKFKLLSVQERKIFGLIRKGFSNKEISAECNIELTTVKSHVSNIYSKLKIKSRKEALNFKTKFL